MANTLTTISLAILTLVSLVASVLAFLQSRETAKFGESSETAKRGEVPAGTNVGRTIMTLTWICLIGGTSVFIYRMFAIYKQWQPLKDHVDGLLLIAAMLAAMILYLQGWAKVRGLSVFALPMLTLIFAWAICASEWTLHPFGEFDSVWKTIHLGAVYLGMFFFVIASIAGGMYIVVQRKLQSPTGPAATRPFASLETIERLIIRTSSVGFALLTIGLVTGLVIVTSDPDQRLGDGWWYSPKVVLATAVWVIYAVVMNVKYTSNFRGARAAWLSIAGLVLLLATFGIATALPPIQTAPTGSGGFDANSPIVTSEVK